VLYLEHSIQSLENDHYRGIYMFKRYFFFFITNILVTMTLYFIAGLVMSYTGVSYGSNTGLLLFFFIIGMGGSFISLLISKWSVKRMMNLQEVAPGSELMRKVHRFAKESGLEGMPEVYVYQSPEINAFATGPSRNKSLVAVSSGLLDKMSEDEADAVLAHEVSHIANGDMVTMTLIQGIVNSFVLFFSYIVTQIILNSMRGDDDDDRGGHGGGFMYYIINNIIYTLLSFLSLPIVMYVSRWREYRADAGSARLVGKEKMIKALEALKVSSPQLEKREKSVEVMGISSRGSFSEYFSSHPPLDKRIKALRDYRGL
jgi:heat shock protein HtpX